MTAISADERACLSHHDPSVRLAALRRVFDAPDAALEHLQVLVDFLDDQGIVVEGTPRHIVDPRGAAFGPTSVDPEKHLSLALEARSRIHALGTTHRDVVLAALRAITASDVRRPRRYHGIRLLGMLGEKSAIPLFERTILEVDDLYVHENPDQFDVFPLAKAAAMAFLQADRAGFEAFVTALEDGSYFEKNPSLATRRTSASHALAEWRATKP